MAGLKTPGKENLDNIILVAGQAIFVQASGNLTGPCPTPLGVVGLGGVDRGTSTRPPHDLPYMLLQNSWELCRAIFSFFLEHIAALVGSIPGNNWCEYGLEIMLAHCHELSGSVVGKIYATIGRQPWIEAECNRHGPSPPPPQG